MIVEFTDSIAGTAVYINPKYVISMRPEPTDPLHVTKIKLSDGETIQVRAEHTEVADKLERSLVT
jgi:hypothetical protein